MVSSNSRTQALRPVTCFSCSVRSTSSESWCGRKLRTESSQGRKRASRGEAARRAASGLVVELVELQRHEQQSRADRGHPFLHALVELADLGVVAMRREQQLREGEHAADAILDRLVALDHAGEAVAVAARAADP